MQSGQHYETNTRDILTPRQEEILALIARGYTNSQIAEKLGFTLAGAKWHVSEIIAKLGVETREEAVEAWRSQQSAGQRFARAARALLGPILVHKAIAAAVAAMTVVIAGTGVALAVRSSASSKPPPTTLPMSSIYGQVVNHPVFIAFRMFDSKVGWAQANDGNTIVLTEDGGITWRNVSPALTGGLSVLPRSMAFIDANHAVVIAAPPRVSPNTDIRARVYWTTNRGKTWQQSDSVVPLGGATSPTFLGSQDGWIFTSTNSTYGVLYRTTDAGQTWNTVPIKLGDANGDPPGSLPATTSCVWSVVRFVTASRGFAAGGCKLTSMLPYLFRTDDAGATWQRVTLPGAVADQYTSAVVGFFKNQSDGLFFANSSGNSSPLYATHNGGLTWAQVGQIPMAQGGGGITSLAAPDLLHGWVFGPTTWQRTVDGGKTWETFTPNPPMPSAQFVSPEEGFAWPGSGQTFSSDTDVPPMYHSTDGGKTWRPVGP